MRRVNVDNRTLEEQLARLKALNYYRQDETAQRELKAAMKTAESDAALLAIMNEWIKDKTDYPTPADIYRLLREQRENTEARAVARKQLPDCLTCEGVGFETRFYLATYRGNSFTVKNLQRIDFGYQERRDLRAKLNLEPKPPFDAQDVISAAVRCVNCAGSGKVGQAW